MEPTSSLSFPDFIVIAGYALSMVGIGVFYARGNRGAEDYVLGGRKLPPWMVGTSLFATLLSTLSYLTYPGEMIRYGPTIFGGLLGFPIAYWIIARWIIPAIMQEKVTSAYEILERRLGLSVRLLASGFFLSRRLMWMATILYATSSKVVVPLLGLSESATFEVSLGIGLVTLLYTTLGGFRAVVLADVIQTLILAGAALLTLALISIEVGGISPWIPDRWPDHWPSPRLGFDAQARMTLANSICSIAVWYVCTVGSDQMAIQRFLATRSQWAARRSLAISMAANAGIQLLLAGVGLAVLAWFAANLERLPAGESLISDSDRLFPLYVGAGLPAGISGLVIAGMMAAAMSSLSSGLNAASSVINEDWLERLFAVPRSEGSALRRLRGLSLLLGILVILVSISLRYVEGNLLEVVLRVVNLWVAPLFSLFFLALFVPWATPRGAWIGALGAVATGVAIAFGGALGLGILWITPASLAVGIALGSAASWWGAKA